MVRRTRATQLPNADGGEVSDEDDDSVTYGLPSSGEPSPMTPPGPAGSTTLTPTSTPSATPPRRSRLSARQNPTPNSVQRRQIASTGKTAPIPRVSIFPEHLSSEEDQPEGGTKGRTARSTSPTREPARRRLRKEPPTTDTRVRTPARPRAEANDHAAKHSVLANFDASRRVPSHPAQRHAPLLDANGKPIWDVGPFWDIWWRKIADFFASCAPRGNWGVGRWLKANAAYILALIIWTLMGSMTITGFPGLGFWFCEVGGRDLGALGYCYGSFCPFAVAYKVDAATTGIWPGTQLFSAALLAVGAGAILSISLSLLIFLRFYCRDTCCSDHVLEQWCCLPQAEKLYQPGRKNLLRLRDGDGRANYGPETPEGALSPEHVGQLARMRFHTVMGWTLLWAVGWGGFLLVWCVAARAKADWGERAAIVLLAAVPLFLFSKMTHMKDSNGVTKNWWDGDDEVVDATAPSDRRSGERAGKEMGPKRPRDGRL